MGVWRRRRRSGDGAQGDPSAPRPEIIGDTAALLGPGGLDAQWYCAILGQEMTREEAVAHYIELGSLRGLTPHPLFEPDWFARAKVPVPRSVNVFAHYLRNPDLWSTPTHPLLDVRGYTSRHPESLQTPGGPPEHYRVHGAAAGEPPSARWLSDAPVLPTLTAWSRALAPTTPLPPVPDGGPLVLVRLAGNLPRLRAHLESMAWDVAEAGAVVVVSTACLTRTSALQAAAITLEFPWVTLQMGPMFGRHPAVTPEALGGHDSVVLVDSTAALERGTIVRLLDALADPGVGAAAAAVCDPNGVLRAVAHGEVLAGFSSDELVGSGRTPIRGGAVGALALRMPDVAAARAESVVRSAGALTDAAWAGLSERVAAAAGDLPVVLVEGALAVTQFGPEPALEIPAGREADWAAFGVQAGPAGLERTDGRRHWALKCPAPAGPTGETWGDLNFARELAAALRGLGERVVIDAAQAFDRPTAALDDVALLIRGLRTWEPAEGYTSLLWVISHPEDVTAEEAAPYTRALVASDPWSPDAQAAWSRPVQPFLQATDPGLFHPEVAQPDSGPAVVFVGGHRAPSRPLVDWAVEAGLPLAVYGHGWTDRLPPGALRAERVGRQEAAVLYRSAGLVLCDHWEDMAELGFIQNRVFDVLAAGGRAVSNPVAGMAALLPGVAQVDGPEALRRLYEADRAEFFGDDAAVRARAAQVAAEHSFEARARALLAMVSA